MSEETSVVVAETPVTPVPRNDGTLVNALTGLGGAQDKTNQTTVGVAPRLTKRQLEELYRIWICRNIVDAYPQEATREWAEITLYDELKICIEFMKAVLNYVEDKVWT